MPASALPKTQQPHQSQHSLNNFKRSTPYHRAFYMGSSFSSRREPLVQQAGDTAGSTGGGLHQLFMIIRKIPRIRNKKPVELCSRCRKINLEDFFDNEATWMTRQPKQMFYLGRLEKETTCVLCQFFYSMRWRPKETELHEETEVYTLRSWLLGSGFALSAAYSASHYAPSRVLCVLPGEPNVCEDDLFRSFFVTDRPPSDADWIVPQSSTAARFFGHKKPSLSALPYSPTSINYPLLRTWCEHCDFHHSTCASAKKTKHMSDEQGAGPAVRCIDCHTREIVEIATSDKFFALSYVWGEQPSPGSECTLVARETASISGARQLPNVIPKVIEDAMIVVTNLGERYLWVDQYCIDQNDANDKHAQIGNMAAIYEGAYATIVAFSATDSASGLPGVSNLTRKPYSSIAHSKHPLSAIRPSAISSARLVTSSVWMTRGWTYQEAILSRRLLIFTDYQVEFVCSYAVWHECTLPGMRDESSRPPARTGLPGLDVNLLKAITPVERPRSACKIPVGINVLTKYIEEYSGRHLTYQSDVLNAITGLLSRISTLTYLGIPIFDVFELAASLPRTLVVEMALWRFLIGLTWYPAQGRSLPLQRRHAFPSWSWLGWEGRVKIPRWLPPHRTHTSVWVTSQQATHTNKGEETLVPFAHLLQESPLSGKEPTSILPHLNNYLWVEGPVIKMAFSHHGKAAGRHDYFELKSSKPPMMGRFTRIYFRNCNPDSCKNQNDAMYRRVITEDWDCLLLAFDDLLPAPLAWFIILDQEQRDEENMEAEEDCHYVVGSAKLDAWSGAGDDHLWDDPSLRRKIKLG